MPYLKQTRYIHLNPILHVSSLTGLKVLVITVTGVILHLLSGVVQLIGYLSYNTIHIIINRIEVSLDFHAVDVLYG